MKQRAKPTDAGAIPPELQRSVPRDVVLTGAGWFVLAMGWVLLAGAIVWPVAGSVAAVRNSALRNRMASEGRTVSAAIVRTYRTTGKHPKNRLVYQFTVAGRTYQRDTRARNRTGARYAVGGTVPVRYLAADPSVNWIEGTPPAGLPVPVVPLMTAGLLASGGLVCWSMGRHRRLLAEGRPVVARLEAANAVRPANARRSTSLQGNVMQIEFDLLDGSTRQAKVQYSSNAVPQGPTTIILYDPDNPKSLMRYPSPLVRVRLPG